MPTLAYHVQAPHPFLVQFGENAGIRWYGLAYVAGFFIGFWLMRRWQRDGWLPLKPAELESFLMWVAVLGTLAGGRLFYCLFYNWSEVASHPLKLFAVWEGGMASHGGILGLGIASWLFARRHRVNVLRLWDALCCAAPPGIFLGRLANFVNGELWGRPTDVPWAVIFPASGDALPRHPSQLYAAGLEGLFLGVVLLLARPRLAGRPGACAGLFVTLYAVVRFIDEFFREPDHGQFFLAWLTKGQFLSLLTAAAGLALLALCFRRPPSRSTTP